MMNDMAFLLDQFEDHRRTAQSRLSISGSAQEVKAFITAMAEAALPVSERYRNIPAKNLIEENVVRKDPDEVLDILGKLVKALSFLEKYGCNLLNPNRPKYWRTVKFNNPVFKASVDTVKGARRILHLYGYTNEMPDGLSFPEETVSPDAQKVAVVAVEVMALHVELDSLVKGTHSHPGYFEKMIPLCLLQQVKQAQDVQIDAVVIQPPLPKPRTSLSKATAAKLVLPPPASEPPAKPSDCDICGRDPSFLCELCGSLPFCEACDQMVHLNPSKKSHTRQRIQPGKQGNCAICGVSPVMICCLNCDQHLCDKCDNLYHLHPSRKGHTRNSVSGTTPTRHAEPEGVIPQSLLTVWECKSCSTTNLGASILCQTCERPRLSKRPLLPKEAPQKPIGHQWECRRCTFFNSNTKTKCEMCDSPQDEPLVKKTGPFIPQASKESNVELLNEPQVLPKNVDLEKKFSMREEGLHLLHYLKEGEKRGISPEEVYAALQASGASSPFDWLHSELPHLQDEICALAASLQPDKRDEHPEKLEEILLSKREAKQAWLAAGGNNQKAVQLLLQSRESKLHALHSMGFKDTLACEKALFTSGGDLEGALVHLQRPLLEPLHNRIWEEPKNHIDVKGADQEHLCRRLLGLYDLPSWGRCQLALSLLNEQNIEYSLEDVIQAVKDHQDKDFILRILKNDCQICYATFPRSKMQVLTACQCSMCSECFVQHFTVGLRDKHIRDMVCPVCEEPDINDPEAFGTYFTTLDMQLRVCLQPDVYELFGKKITEHALMKDPKFLWCCHCTNGFINDKDDFQVTCPNCKESFCSKCKKPWEEQHKDISCNDFQAWKRENDPEYQKQGLAGYLRENGINCPSCKFQYALAKGGCMHFTCSQCRYEFCCGCNNPYHKKACASDQCTLPGLHAHHPRDCLFYLRDWEPPRLQALLQTAGVEFNTDPPEGIETGNCGVMEQKDGSQPMDAACGIPIQEGHAGLCDKHYREYLVSLINDHSIDPTNHFDQNELLSACRRYQLNLEKMENEDDETFLTRLRQELMATPIGENVPRNM